MRSSDGVRDALVRGVRDALGWLAALVVAAAVMAGTPGAALAVGPTPTPGIGDPRSSGQGPGLVGDPLTAVLVVAAIAVVTMGITLAYVRLTGRSEDAGRS
jgi:hypothetical protein